MALSAFSQLGWPKESSDAIWSKVADRGPAPSFFPATLAQPVKEGGADRAAVCPLSFFVSITVPPRSSLMEDSLPGLTGTMSDPSNSRPPEEDGRQLKNSYI